ncbi:hypothetical protein L6452_43832 [Arctium lappa]|uniref:Uncharacterized protein n=1 Tax=Arctium lappa TaxID=4217 RepID=A0ACB8XED4_ARCLA|nr:hypothetical protein L6452_43832 [Arctium lappa]
MLEEMGLECGMIRDMGNLVTDINYFPGYEKLDGFEVLMMEFFLGVKNSEKQKMMTTIVDDESHVLNE